MMAHTGQRHMDFGIGLNDMQQGLQEARLILGLDISSQRVSEGRRIADATKMR